MPTTRIGDIDIAYEVTGEGPPLLAIMGLTGSMGHWWGFPQRFSDRFRVITFDNRGVGATSAPAGAYSTTQLAKDALGLLDHLGIHETAVYGVSMGGMIAQELALAVPERITKLVLGCTSFGGLGSVMPPPETLAAFATVGKGGAEATVRRLLMLNFGPKFLEEKTAVFDELVAYGLANRMSPAGFQGQLAAVSTHDAAARVKDVRVPTLIITGTHDRLIPAGNAALLAGAIPGSKVITLEGIGHMYWIEAAEDAEKAIREFLRPER